MAAEGLDAVIIVQSADLYYFTGTIQTGALYIPADRTAALSWSAGITGGAGWSPG